MDDLQQQASGDSTPPTPARGVLHLGGDISRRRFLAAGSVASAGFFFYSGEIARHAIQVIAHTIHIAHLPEPFHGLRVVQLSDIHYDNFSEPGFIRSAIDQINALKPDMVLLTGDFVSKGPEMYVLTESHAHLCAELLKDIACPHRYAIMGNHDASVGPEIVTRALRQNGITVLSDSYVSLERDGQRVWLVGLRDAAAVDGIFPDLEAAMPPALPHEPVLLMVHEPDYVDILLESPLGARTDMVFSGHTHGGQVRLPVVGPLLLPLLGKNYVHGAFQFQGRDRLLQLYVNRGLGTVGLPIRLNCPPEITLHTLSAEPV